VSPTEGDSCTDSFAYTPPLKLFREFLSILNFIFTASGSSGIDHCPSCIADSTVARDETKSNPKEAEKYEKKKDAPAGI